MVPRNRYVEIRSDKPTNPKQHDWPEYKTCKFTTEAIVTEDSEKGELRRVCANPDCPVHHARKPKPATDTAGKAEQEKRRREEATFRRQRLQAQSIIPANRRSSCRACGARLQMRDNFPTEQYGKRSLIESAFSAVKRKLSCRAPGGTPHTQSRQALLLGLALVVSRVFRTFVHREHAGRLLGWGCFASGPHGGQKQNAQAMATTSASRSICR